MNKSHGFSPVLVVVLIATVVLLGFVGWRIYDATKPSGQAQTGGQAQSGNQQTSTGQSPATYLDIKELGAKVKLDAKTAGETYSYKASSDSKGYNAVIFDATMKTVDSANQYCSGANAGLIGTLTKSNDPYYFSTGGTKAVVVDNRTSFKIGDYYFVFQPPQAECSQDSTISAQRASHQQDFINVLSSIQAD